MEWLFQQLMNFDLSAPSEAFMLDGRWCVRFAGALP